MKFVYWAFVVIMIVAAVLFALSNRVPIDVGLWPLPYFSVPTYGVVLGAFAVGFLSGGFWFWLRALTAKAKEKSTGRRADRLQRELDTVKSQEETSPKGTSVIAAAAPGEALQKQPGTG